LKCLSDILLYIEQEYYCRGKYGPELSVLISAFLFEQHCVRGSMFSVYYEAITVSDNAKSFLKSELLRILTENFDQWIARVITRYKIEGDEIKSIWDDNGKFDVFDPLTLIFQSLQTFHVILFFFCADE
jgi:hypothetical protein